MNKQKKQEWRKQEQQKQQHWYNEEEQQKLQPGALMRYDEHGDTQTTKILEFERNHR